MMSQLVKGQTAALSSGSVVLGGGVAAALGASVCQPLAARGAATNSGSRGRWPGSWIYQNTSAAPVEGAATFRSPVLIDFHETGPKGCGRQEQGAGWAGALALAWPARSYLVLCRARATKPLRACWMTTNEKLKRPETPLLFDFGGQPKIKPVCPRRASGLVALTTISGSGAVQADYYCALSARMPCEAERAESREQRAERTNAAPL